MLYRVQFLPVDGRGPYFVGIEALTTSELAEMLLNCSDEEAVDLFGEYSIPHMESAISMIQDVDRRWHLTQLYYNWHHEPECDKTMEDLS